jgi:hypothetical protein
VDKVGDAGFVVLDRDNAGGLLDSFRANAAGKRSFVALFSCSSGEMMPRSSDWPPDLFTACLPTPAKVAVIWHSRNYYCFSTGPLHPLPASVADGLVEIRHQKASEQSEALQGTFQQLLPRNVRSGPARVHLSRSTSVDLLIPARVSSQFAGNSFSRQSAASFC